MSKSARFLLLLLLIVMVLVYAQAFGMRRRQRYLAHLFEEYVTLVARENNSSDKKIVRNGVLLTHPKAQATILVCHGFMCDKYDINFLRLMFKDYNCLMFDFRAHGENNQDQCCTFGRDESYDVLAAVEFIKSHPELKDKPLIAYGFSMGAVAAIIAQAQDNNLFDAMILDCPFDSSDKLLERGINQLKINLFGYELALPGVSWLKGYAYSPYIQSLLKTILKTIAKMDATQITTCICPVYPEEAIKYVTVPCFIIGCIHDDKATEDAVRAVYAGAAGYKRLWLTLGRRHFDSVFYKMDDYFYRVNKFVKDYLTKRLAHKKQEKIKRDQITPIMQPPERPVSEKG